MIALIQTTICCVLFIESFIALGIAKLSKEVQVISSKAVWVIRSPRISDHWKERAVLSYAAKLLGLSIKLLCFLIISFSPFYIIDMFGSFLGLELFGFLVSPIGIIWTTVFGSTYAIFRLRLARK